MTIKEKVIEIIKQLPKESISDSRIPYTYHHDYIRVLLKGPIRSRAEIAITHPSEDELYAGTLFYLIVRDPLMAIKLHIPKEFIEQCEQIINEELKKFE